MEEWYFVLLFNTLMNIVREIFMSYSTYRKVRQERLSSPHPFSTIARTRKTGFEPRSL